ncbi:MAG TPA: alpha-amylase family glycosyl hydrolase [Terriglobales bacterium]|nr:alpha-amylase family glycosyl hydrolase [Terriglobales bacterium]
MIDLKEVGAFPSFDLSNQFSVRFGIYLPDIRDIDGFELLVRIIHTADRFDPSIPPKDFNLAWQNGHPLDLWTGTVDMHPDPQTHFGQEGMHLYRYQLWWTSPAGNRQLITSWITDPFARATDVGRMSAFTLTRNSVAFQWTDDAHKTPELDDLIVYELQVEQFNDTFDGVVDRLDYLQSIGINCIELMPVTSAKVNFDWGYGPLHYFAPNARFGEPDDLKHLVDVVHSRGMAVILDVVYQHVDTMFPYFRVYDDVNNSLGTPRVPSPMIGTFGQFGPQSDFSKTFTQEYFFTSNRWWLEEYHVDGFRYDEVDDYYFSPTDTAYAKLVYDTYQYSLGIPRFQQSANSYSRIIQCAEALGKSHDILTFTYSNASWQNGLLDLTERAVSSGNVTADYPHQLDPSFLRYPNTKTVTDGLGNPVDMPVAPFQYLESHDHSQLIVSAGTVQGNGPLLPGNRDRWFKLQPHAIALYTLQGIPMLWEGQEFADNYPLPDDGVARIYLRRDVHWEYFYDEQGSPLIRLYRTLGGLRRNVSALRSRESFYYFQQSLQNSQIVAYHRHAPAADANAESWAMVLLNFGDGAGDISLPFPAAGTWREMIDDSVRSAHLDLQVGAAGDAQQLTVPSNYGQIWIKQ